VATFPDGFWDWTEEEREAWVLKFITDACALHAAEAASPQKQSQRNSKLSTVAELGGAAGSEADEA
jgi:hypothetical protein